MIAALADILAEMGGFGLGNPDDLTASPSLHQPLPTTRPAQPAIGGFDKF